jgi:hypothetical protein
MAHLRLDGLIVDEGKHEKVIEVAPSPDSTLHWKTDPVRESFILVLIFLRFLRPTTDSLFSVLMKLFEPYLR